MIFPPIRLRRRTCATSGEIFGHTGKETLRFPLPVPSRLAVIDADFHIAGNMRALESGDTAGLLGYAPEALALPLASALSLADRKLRGLLDLPGLRYAMVVFTSVSADDDEPIASHHRDLLWKAFGLPVFEQLRGWNGRVMARECEVHDGLHFDPNYAMAEIGGGELFLAGIPTGIPARIVTEPCDCGMETPRLLHGGVAAARTPTGKVRAAAA